MQVLSCYSTAASAYQQNLLCIALIWYRTKSTLLKLLAPGRQPPLRNHALVAMIARHPDTGDCEHLTQRSQLPLRLLEAVVTRPVVAVVASPILKRTNYLEVLSSLASAGCLSLGSASSTLCAVAPSTFALLREARKSAAEMPPLPYSSARFCSASADRPPPSFEACSAHNRILMLAYRKHMVAH